MSNLSEFGSTESLPTIQKSPKKAIEAPDPQNGIAGELRLEENGDSIYVSERNRKEHFFRKYDGYAISKSILKKLKNRNVWNVLIIEKHNRVSMKYNTRSFSNDDIAIQYINEGEEQKVVPTDYATIWEDVPVL